jgi:truncated hemoglobin YjbI
LMERVDSFRIADDPLANSLSDCCRASGESARRYNSSMGARSALLEALGGEEGCRGLSAAFYVRVGKDPILRPFFPGKSLRCATEEFAAFLIQFLGGDENQTQYRWWLSLRESHARFQIGPNARNAWLRHMEATLDAAPLDDATRNALRDFFSRSSAYVIGRDVAESDHDELAARWREQRVLDTVIAAIAEGRDDETVALAPRFASRPSVFVGLLARMVQSGRARLVQFVIDAAESDPSLASRRFAGTTLLHFAAGAGCLEVVALLLRVGVDPNIVGRGGHTPLYCVANECASETGPEVVRALVRAGADVNAGGGVTRATALHMAARRGHVEIARTLLDSGAAVNARDYKGCTPLQRAINCRKNGVSQLLLERVGHGTNRARSDAVTHD